MAKMVKRFIYLRFVCKIMTKATHIKINLPMNFSFHSQNDLLEALPLFGITDEVVQRLSENLQTINIKSNQVLVKPGQVNTHLYYVLKGGFVCRYISEEAEVERTINFYLNELHPVMACIDSFFSQTKTACELRAISDAMVLAIPKTTLDNLIAQSPPLKTLFDTMLITVLTEENDLKLKIIALKPDALYQYLINTFPVLVQRVPSRYIAELMGISAEWLSKLKSKQRHIS
jgi:CRP-like cAMP-binding protein